MTDQQGVYRSLRRSPRARGRCRSRCSASCRWRGRRRCRGCAAGGPRADGAAVRGDRDSAAARTNRADPQGASTGRRLPGSRPRDARHAAPGRCARREVPSTARCSFASCNAPAIAEAVTPTGDRSRRCGRLPDQRQRQQRRGVAVRAAGRIRQQPAQRALALQRRHRHPVRQLGAGRAAVLVHRAARRRSRYSDTQIVASFAGPLKIPHLIRTRPTCFSATSTGEPQRQHASALMPTAPERAGDFSQQRDALGQPARIVDPCHRAAVPRQRDSASRISPQAASLLGLLSRCRTSSRRPLQLPGPVLVRTRQDAAAGAADRTLSNKNQLFGNLALQRTTTDPDNVFGFTDSSRVGHRRDDQLVAPLSQFSSLGCAISSRGSRRTRTPYFANRTNVSGDAGITGNNQDPMNWGPPRLHVLERHRRLGSAGIRIEPQSDAHRGARACNGRAAATTSRSAAIRGASARTSSRSRTRAAPSPSPARRPGSISPTSCSGSRLRARSPSATPTRISRAPAYDAYVTDDWRVSPTLTINAGVRWEYEAPDRRAPRPPRRISTSRRASRRRARRRAAVGSVTDRVSRVAHSTGLRGLQPRLGMALRPVAGSSLVIRAGYGIYRNTGVYQPIASLLAQQPPLSKTFSVENSAANPLTLANGFTRRRPPRSTPSPSIPTSASATRTTGRCSRSAICRRR